MPNPFSELGHTLQGKTAGIPHWAIVAAGGLAVGWYLLRNKSNAPQPTTQRVSGALGGVARATTGSGGAGGGTAVSGPPLIAPNTPLAPVQPSVPSWWSLPPSWWLFPQPGNTTGNNTSTTLEPAPPNPAPSEQIPSVAPNVSWTVSPIGVTPPFPITVAIGALSGADEVKVFARGTDSYPASGLLDWHQWDYNNGGNFQTQIPTNDYANSQYIAVALELLRNGSVVATGNPIQPGYDARLQQVVAINR